MCGQAKAQGCRQVCSLPEGGCFRKGISLEKSMVGIYASQIATGFMSNSSGETHSLGKTEEGFCFCFPIFGHLAAYGISGPGIRFELKSQFKPHLCQCWILNPLCWARDGTCHPPLPRCQQGSCFATGGSPRGGLFSK